jgi:hypothetical protein
VLGRVSKPPVVTPIIDDAYRTSVLTTPDVTLLAVRLLVIIVLARMPWVEIKGGMTLFVNRDVTVEVSCPVLTEFPPVMLDTERNLVKTFWVDNWIYNAILFTREVFYTK